VVVAMIFGYKEKAKEDKYKEEDNGKQLFPTRILLEE
jgi:hypothetical protein